MSKQTNNIFYVVLCIIFISNILGVIAFILKLTGKGTINDSSGGNSLANDSTLVIDGIRPTVSKVTSSTSNEKYKIDDTINIQVVFSEKILVTGMPTLTLTTNATTNSTTVVDYNRLSTTTTKDDTMNFTYTVAEGDNSSNLDYASINALSLNKGTIKDAAGNTAILTLASPGTSNSLGANKALVIDGIRPTVSKVTSSASNDKYKIGVPINVQVVFSEKIIVTGMPTLMPTLTLTTNATTNGTTVVDYNGLSTTTTSDDTMNFTYTIAKGDNSSNLDYASINALSLNGGTIKDAAGNTAILTLASPGTPNSLGANKALVIDGIQPTVSKVTSSTSNGKYKIGDKINIQVVFSKKILVTDMPTLTLTTNATTNGTTVVNYNRLSTTTTSDDTINFIYTIAEGDNSGDLDYASINALSLNGGTIKDAAGNTAILTLASPGTPNSLGASKAIVIDGIKPYISSIWVTNVPKQGGQIGTDTNNYITVNFSEPVFKNNNGTGDLTASDFTLTIQNGTAKNPYLTDTGYTNGISMGKVTNTRYRFKLYPLNGYNGEEILLVNPASGSSIYDAAGNAMNAIQSNMDNRRPGSNFVITLSIDR